MHTRTGRGIAVSLLVSLILSGLVALPSSALIENVTPDPYPRVWYAETGATGWEVSASALAQHEGVTEPVAPSPCAFWVAAVHEASASAVGAHETSGAAHGCDIRALYTE